MLPGLDSVREPAEAMKWRTDEKLLALPIAAATDAMEVLFNRKGQPPQLITLYMLQGETWPWRGTTA